MRLNVYSLIGAVHVLITAKTIINNNKNSKMFHVFFKFLSFSAPTHLAYVCTGTVKVVTRDEKKFILNRI